MEPLDVVKQVRSGFISRPVGQMAYSFPVEHSEEALAGGIVTAMTHGTHAADQRIATQESLVFTTDKLAATIRVQYHFRFSLSLPDRYLDGTNHHVTILAVMHRPAHYQLAVRIEHHTQEKLAFQCWNPSDIRYPLAVRFDSRKVAIQ